MESCWSGIERTAATIAAQRCREVCGAGSVSGLRAVTAQAIRKRLGAGPPEMMIGPVKWNHTAEQSASRPMGLWYTRPPGNLACRIFQATVIAGEFDATNPDSCCA
jgi:hypothetical protein